ncbi:MAG: aminoacyl-tRNA deacylase [Alphaproteobacteria bacterium]
MPIAATLKQYLKDQGVEYDVQTHLRTPSSSRSAQAAHVSGERVAKAVVLHDAKGYVLAVIPATHRLELDTVQRLLDRRLNLASEGEIGELFKDCDLGAVPAVGAAYGLDVILDEILVGQPDVFFEGGDHSSLVHVGGQEFEKLMANARRGRFSHHV